MIGGVLMLLGLAMSGRATVPTCARCGHEGACRKTCRLEPEERKVEIVCWGMQREEFCVPGCSKPGCRHCEEVCGPADDSGKADEPCSKARKFQWREWFPPRGAKLYTKRKLMKKVVTRKVPGYKWVVETLCEECLARCAPIRVEPGVEIPPPPSEPDLKVIR